MKLSVKPAPIRTVEIFDEDDLHVLLKIKTFFWNLWDSDRISSWQVRQVPEYKSKNWESMTRTKQINSNLKAQHELRSIITWNPRGLSNGSFQPFGQTEKVTLSLNLEFCGIQDSMAKWEVVATPIWYICVGI